jgi:oxalate decarboxylase/phosphoglucose isomerase-like protein (cupin superfamily)
MSIVHIHPRSSELFIVTEGTIISEMALEAGTNDDGSNRSIQTKLGPGQMTVFPQGALHTQFNPNCTPAVAVASFVSDDPGFEGIIPATFSLRDQVIVNSFGDAIPAEDLEKFKDSLPKDIFLLVEECMAQCSQNQTTH